MISSRAAREGLQPLHRDLRRDERHVAQPSEAQHVLERHLRLRGVARLPQRHGDDRPYEHDGLRVVPEDAQDAPVVEVLT